MRIGNRDNDSQDNMYTNIQNEMVVHSKVYDTVMLVNPSELSVLKIYDNRMFIGDNTCHSFCPLCKDICGCICKETLSTMEIRMRFTFNKTTAYLVICNPVITKYKNYVMVLIKKLDPTFSFGGYKADDMVKQITNLSSNLVLDTLTKIYNRNYLLDNIEYQIKDAVNTHKYLSLACIDIDNFKQFNDTYGHEFGDKVLIKVAEKMKESIRGMEGTYPVRIGGDEFLIVGINIPKQRFKIIMNKLCQLVDSTKLPYNNILVGIRISVGVSEVLEDKVHSYKELYNKADSQLYLAKEAGKGCVR